MSETVLDQAGNVRPEEALDIKTLSDYLSASLPNFEGITELRQFPGGYSNLTYLIKTPHREFVLRKPPRGAKIKSAHDMKREYHVLTLLQPVYKKMPSPFVYCEDESVIGAPFFVMERVSGIILRHTPPKNLHLNADAFKRLSTNCLLNLVDLHNLELQKSQLITLG
ncbi:MAG: phosphotransferase family protein, partial [Zetaproteobacteria bacterium]|nr:phosphotransferase family protein [Flavobacteriales bacterium]